MLRRAVIAGAIALAAWLVLSLVVAPGVIASAYRNESYPWVNGLIGGREKHSLEAYQAAWRRFALIQAVTIPAGVIALVTVLPQLRPVARDREFHGMSPGRACVAYAVVAALIVGQAIATLGYVELWPFSNYPMYASAKSSRNFTALAIVGVDERGNELPAGNLFPPFDRARLAAAIRQHRAAGDLPQTLDALLKLQSPEAAARLVGIRIYELEWELEGELRNLEAPQRTLVAEHFAD
jgi:hypothetical protein